MEIGSIFEINPEELFSDTIGDISLPFMTDEKWNIQFFNTGRSAIEAFLHTCKNIKRVWVPSFICSSVIEAIARAGKEIIYYPIDRYLLPDIEFLSGCEVRNGDVIYVMHYFGIAIQQEFIDIMKSLRSRGILIFEDITMSLLSKKGNDFAFGDIVLGSIRKWYGIPDGAFIASMDRLPDIKKENAAYDYTLYYFTAQIMKSLYLSDSKKYDKERFLSFSNKGIESLFSDYTIREMSEISYRVLGSINWEEISIKRHNNYDLLYALLKDIPKIKILGSCSDKIVPIGMFILTDDRDGLLKHLISKGIYCNVHWRENEATEQFPDTLYLSRHCLTIPCDHRYGEDHMNYIQQVIKQF